MATMFGVEIGQPRAKSLLITFERNDLYFLDLLIVTSRPLRAYPKNGYPL